MEQETKIYYLPPYRSIAIGVILMLMGLGLTFGIVDFNQSLWQIIQFIFISFEGVVEFFFSLLLLAFKIGFIIGGYLYLWHSSAIERAKIGPKGIYYREIPKGSKYDKMALDLRKLIFVPYSDIIDMTCEKSFWMGWQLYLTLTDGRFPLIALGVLKFSEKQEIVATVKKRISFSHKH